MADTMVVDVQWDQELIMRQLFDVLVIGGGVVGSAIARELARYELSIGVLEKNLDVCDETSGRNSGVVHGGFAYDTGSWKAKLCLQGNRLMGDLSAELGFDFLRCGKVLVGNTDAEYAQLERTLAQGRANGVQGLEMVDEKRLHELVPSVIGKFAMYSPNSGIVDPFGLTIALAENAAMNGVAYFFDREVEDIRRVNGIYELVTNDETYRCRWVVNAAGLGCGKVSDMLGITGYKVIGSKGDYIILDKRTGPLLPMPAYPVPSNTYMGIHVTNTTDGNVIVGPTAEATGNFAYYGVYQKNIDYLAESGSRLWPHIRKQDYIRTYCGILPKWVDEKGVIQDFKMEIKDDIAPNAVNLVGIESPGLTASVPIARHVIDMMREREPFKPNVAFNPRRKGLVRFSRLSPDEQAELVKENPDYGQIVCRCQNISKAEMLEAIHNPLGVKTMTGVKYRTRGMMGRCQGGYCQMRIAQLLEKELGLADTEVVYSRKGSNLFVGKVREDKA